jgi:hypothetical protein
MAGVSKQIYEYPENTSLTGSEELLHQATGAGPYEKSTVDTLKDYVQLKPRREQFTLSGAQIAAKQVVLAGVPTAASLKLEASGQGSQLKGVSWDFTAPNIIYWNGLFLDGVLTVGFLIEVTYLEA